MLIAILRSRIGGGVINIKLNYRTNALLVQCQWKLGIRLQLIVFIADVNPLIFHDMLQP